MRVLTFLCFAYSNFKCLDCFLIPQSLNSEILPVTSAISEKRHQEHGRSSLSNPLNAVAALLLTSGTAHAFHSRPPAHAFRSRPVRIRDRHHLQPLMTVATVETGDSLLKLLAERRYRAVFERAFEEPKTLIAFLQDAGFAGVLSYIVAALAFYSIAVPIGEVAYQSATGQWFDPRTALSNDATTQAEAVALIASFILACKPFAPVRLAGALVLTPDVKNAFDTLDAQQQKRKVLKQEFFELAEKSRGGIEALQEADQARLEEIILSELPALNPTPEPARSGDFSGQWECKWTTEQELNFAVDKGLFGLPWRRTYQNIDVENGKLSNVIEFEDGALTVNSSIEPDKEGDGSRFNFAFSDCSVRWRGLEVPLPPVGKGWGELLYLDKEMRIQRDIRGDLLVASKV